MSIAQVHAPSGGAAVTPDRFLRDAVEGLTATPRRLSPKYFYDARGSALFERICGLDEYYVTRTELAIMRRHVAAMADRIGPHCLLIEPGSGSGRKTRLLLDHLEDPAGYVPVEISRSQLVASARALDESFDGLHIWPVHADFVGGFELPEVPGVRRRVVYFPGSTIGNFSPPAARKLLSELRRVAGDGGGLLIGVDLKKDVEILKAAYNDKAGVTAEFNRNVLRRIRDELDVDVDPDQFEHLAFYNRAEGRVEMHLVSTRAQSFRLNGTTVSFKPGETIHTESSYKFDQRQLESLFEQTGWRRADAWTDQRDYFSVQYCEAAR